MSDGKPCIFKHMVKLPYMEAGIVIMTDLSVVKKLKKLGILSQRWKGEGGGGQASWDKIPSLPGIFRTTPFTKNSGLEFM